MTVPSKPPGIPVPVLSNTNAVAFQPFSVANGLGLEDFIVALPSSANPSPVAKSPGLHLAAGAYFNFLF